MILAINCILSIYVRNYMQTKVMEVYQRKYIEGGMGIESSDWNPYRSLCRSCSYTQNVCKNNRENKIKLLFQLNNWNWAITFNITVSTFSLFDSMDAESLRHIFPASYFLFWISLIHERSFFYRGYIPPETVSVCYS